ncbi:MAG: hypothetical protein JRN39_04580 [Nitrososphaerota archaeon]|nr:hypothetical protein [Nitrososphaerota archaeon]MDG6939661.1 hypothetical protein [Nitrososphaerota archaeon]
MGQRCPSCGGGRLRKDRLPSQAERVRYECMECRSLWEGEDASLFDHRAVLNAARGGAVLATGTILLFAYPAVNFLVGIALQAAGILDLAFLVASKSDDYHEMRFREYYR